MIRIRRIFAGFALLLASATLADAPAFAADGPLCTPQAPTAFPLVYRSVDILPDGHVRFRFCAPAAVEVKLVSMDIAQVPIGFDGKPAGLPMAKDANGYWSLTTPEPIAPGTYRYAFDADSARTPDPRATRFAEGFQGISAVLDVPGPSVAFQMPQAGVPHGMVAVIEYPSSTLGTVRRAHVYTPPGYEGRDRASYPVLYLVHGAGDSDDSWTAIGHANDILDTLIAAGKAKPMIVVMPYGHTPERAGLDRMTSTDFGGDLLRDLIPYIDAHFRTQRSPKGRAMAGLSMGGGHTIHFGIPHPEIFGDVGVFSMGLQDATKVASYRALHDADLKRRAAAPGLVYYAIGRDDFLYKTVAPTRQMLDDYHIAYSYHESDGGHIWRNWRDYLADFAPRIFRTK